MVSGRVNRRVALLLSQGAIDEPKLLDWWRIFMRWLVARSAVISSILSGFALQTALMVSGVLAAQILGQEGRGQLALLILLPTILVQVGDVGLPVAITYFVARARPHAANVVAATFSAVVFQVVLLSALHLVIAYLLFSSGDTEIRVTGYFLVALIPAELVQRYGLAIVQGQQHYRMLNLLRVLPSFLYALFLIGIFFLEVDALGLIALTFMASRVFTGAITILFVRRNLPRRDRALSIARRPIIGYGLKSFLGSFSAKETLRLDQAIIGLFLSPAALGLYVVATAFTNLPSFVAKSIGLVAYPRIASGRDSSHGRRPLWRYFWLNLVGVLLIVIVLGMSAEWLVPFFFGSEFSDAVSITRILLISAMFTSARRVLTEGLRGEGRPGAGSAAESVSWITLLPSLTVLTPQWGLEGVGFSLVVSSAISLAFLIGLAVRLDPQPPLGSLIDQ